jgi:gliding motility-associated-like protein
VNVCANQLPYTWNNVQYNQPGTYFFVTTNSVGCDSTATLVLSVTPTITGTTQNVNVCASTLPYVWNDSSYTQSGTYTKTVQAQSGCDSIAVLNLVVSPLATASVSGGNPICQGTGTTLSVVFTGTAPWTMVYSDGTTTHTVSDIQSSPYELRVSPTVNTTYSILSVSDLKCVNTQVNSSITINVIPTEPGVRYPTVTALANVPKELVARNLGADYKYKWNPPVGLSNTEIVNPLFKHNATTQFTITLTPSNGCQVVDTMLVIVNVQGQSIYSDLFVPKAWSPNKDGYNDALRPLCVNIRRLYYFRIFNRWGQLMFETNEIGKGWDGMFNGKPQVQDVYTWTVEAVGLDEKYYKRSGNSILLR